MPRGRVPIPPDGLPRPRRALALAVLVVLVGIAVASDTLHARLSALIVSGEGLIAHAPAAGMAVFVVLSAFSAMFAFFSSGLLSPVAIAAWGKAGTFGLLWLGWLLGGIVTYAVGRYLGRSAASVFVRPETLALWEARVGSRAHVTHVLLFQIAMPSEVLGYVLGLVRYSFRTYLAVLAVTEVPYALAVVYLGESFLDGDARTFLVIGAAVVAASAALYYLVRRTAAQGGAT